ncbi:MAG: carbonate dehydratase [Deltaproteobacteria bacterium]|nr:carbonate dehydratase [Deltaproteobacteria bacterium]
MKNLRKLFDQNAEWAGKIREEDPSFFERLSKEQTPEYLWIGCSDSRVPGNQIVGLEPGELFVHRNVANLVIHTDLNCLSAMQFAVEILRVKHVIICGHYGCGGVNAALQNQDLGLITNWLRHIQDIVYEKCDELEKITDDKARCDRLCELNVIQQVMNAGRTTVVQDAWKRGQELTVHGWIYSLRNGALMDLGVCVRNADEMQNIWK